MHTAKLMETKERASVYPHQAYLSQWKREAEPYRHLYVPPVLIRRQSNGGIQRSLQIPLVSIHLQHSHHAFGAFGEKRASGHRWYASFASSLCNSLVTKII
jgi:hypothetical protein